MRRRWLVLALLGTTCLTPVRAEAGAVSLFVSGLAASFGATATATTAAVATALGGAAQAGFVVGSFLFGSAIGQVVLSLGISAIAQALAPRPGLPTPSARMINVAQPVSYMETVYGRTRKGGVKGLDRAAPGADVVTGRDGKKRHYTVVFAAHECQGVVEHRLGERIVALDGSGTITTAPMAGYGRIRFYRGAAGQAADPELLDKFDWMTAAHDYRGLCYSALWAREAGQKLAEVYPDGQHWDHTPVIDGLNQVWDPRDATRKFTDNAALVYADWVIRHLGQDVDWDEVAVEADASDVQVTNAAAEQQPRWTINGVISDDMDRQTQMAQMMGAANVFAYERPDGRHGFKVGRWLEPSVTLTRGDFETLELDEGDLDISAPTEITAKYVEPENGWRETPAGTHVIEAVVPPTRQEPQLYLVTNHNQAARLAVQMAAAQRPRYRLKASLGPIGFELRGQRFFRMVHSELGLDAYFEVLKFSREGPLTFVVEAASITPEAFADDITEPERPEFSPPETAAATAVVIPVPTGLTAAVIGDGSTSIRFEWTAQPEQYAQEVRFRQKMGTGEGAIYSAWSVRPVTAGESGYLLTGLADQVNYELQVRNVSSGTSGRTGDWSAAIERVAIANSTAPAAHASFGAALAGSDVALAFRAANDVNHYATRIYRATDSTDFGTAALIRTEYGLPSSAGSYTDPAPGAGDQSYWIEPINTSGVAGTRSGPETVTVP